MIEGGAGLVALMGKMEAGEVALVDAPDGSMHLSFRTPHKRRAAAPEAQR
jgi:hypothetical protein